jgi:hypothetical protein
MLSAEDHVHVPAADARSRRACTGFLGWKKKTAREAGRWSVVLRCVVFLYAAKSVRIFFIALTST